MTPVHHIRAEHLLYKCSCVDNCYIQYNLEQSVQSIWAHLFPWPTSKTVGVELVGMKDVDGTFNTEMMKLAGDL